LQSAADKNELAYGIHRSSSALATCMVKAYEGDHVHFVDGADGGYALAARQLKAQLSEELRPARAITPAEKSPARNH
jgi:hypothetical protein